MGHGHSHHHSIPPISETTKRILLVAVIPFLLATLIGLVVLWPSEDLSSVRGTDPTTGGAGATETYSGTVTSVATEPCDSPGQEDFTCSEVEVDLEDAPDDSVTLIVAEGTNVKRVETGDSIRVGRSSGAPSGSEYFFQDYQRGRPLLVLGILFAAVVIALSRWRGIMALLGTVISLIILVVFVLPSILEGNNPLAVAVVGGSAIMFIALYLAHGVNARTTTALLGTVTSLLVTGILALIFVGAANFSGFGSEEAVYLQISAQQVNLTGLLLGGIIIGTLGVLDDVTVTQASAVWELRVANPNYTATDLYRSALRIGRDHIASTVNTLVLAYAGAALPLLIVFTLAERPLGTVLTGEIIAEEIVRTLVGSIGLVASVPITTGLAAIVASRSDALAYEAPSSEGPEGYRPPKAEAMWRSEP